MKYNIIQSGSDGNAIVINDFFLLDCGISYRSLKQYLKNIKLIFVSHCHLDHLNKTCVKQIAYNKPNIKFIVGSTDLIDELIKCGVKSSNIYALISSKWYDLGIIKIKLEKVNHDVPNHLCKFQVKDKKGIYIVDTGNVDNIVAKDYDLYLIEANYMDDILEENKHKLDENNEYDHLYRVENVHLSYAQANEFLINNMKKDSVFEYIHKSKMNFKEKV